MKAREIVRRWIWNNGYNQPIKAEDGVKYGEAGRNFTERQLEKLEDMRASISESTLKKWDIPKAERKDATRHDAVVRMPQRSDD